jgi:hypothetical protein
MDNIMSHTSGKWNDLIMPVVGLGVSSTVPSPQAFLTNLSAYGFQRADQLYGCFEILHDYKEGSNLRFHIHWAPSSINNGNVVWQLDLSCANVNYVLPATELLTKTEAACGVANTHQLTEFEPILSGTGKKIGCIVPFRLRRGEAGDGDTFTGLAIALSIGVHYECDGIGSNQIFIKN